MRELRIKTNVAPSVRPLVAYAIGLVVIALDQVTKYWASGRLIGSSIEVIPNVLSFQYAENTGAAFGMFRGQGAGIWLGAAAVLAVGIVVYALDRVQHQREVVALGLVGGGALGNLVDRITNSDDFLAGFVVDWIRFPNFPNFNIADSAITVGAVLLVIVAWRTDAE